MVIFQLLFKQYTQTEILNAPSYKFSILSVQKTWIISWKVNQDLGKE